MESLKNIQGIIEGCLLGDGHIFKGEHSKTPSFQYSTASKQHAEFVNSHLKEYCSDNYQKIKRRESFDSRTNKTYVNYFFRTKHLSVFDEVYERFYVNKIKVIPLDIEINDKTALFWYIGDGQLEKKSGEIILHTNSFTKTEVIFLCEKLKMFKAHARIKEKGKNQYLIVIPRNKVKLFLSFIGPCPFSDYSHKWCFVEYKNKNIEENGINYYTDIYPLIEEKIKNGTTIIRDLVKEFNVPMTAIKNHLKKINVEYELIHRKAICQYSLDGELIKEWDGGFQIKKELNYSASAISECCRGIRKQYKNYIWKFSKNY